jgi:Ca-activated chloride channel family protein
MSFATPLPLLGLLALPVLGALYAGVQRTRGLAAAAFAEARMAPSVTPGLPGWRRHAPIALLALALAALVLAAARPRVTISTTVAHLQTVLALDMSGSMQAHDIAPSRAAAAQRAADDFVDGLPAAVGVGVMQFNQDPQLLAVPTRNHRAAIEALGRLRIGGGTAIGSAIDSALAILRPTADPNGGAREDPARTPDGAELKGAAAAIVLLSDGGSTSGDDPLAAARAARRLHIPVFTVALGTPTGTISVPHRDGKGVATIPVPVQSRELAQVAALSGGHAYTAADAGHLSAIYKQLSARLSHRRERRDLTPDFVGAGLALLLLGSALSLTWFGRLV